MQKREAKEKLVEVRDSLQRLIDSVETDHADDSNAWIENIVEEINEIEVNE